MAQRYLMTQHELAHSPLLISLSPLSLCLSVSLSHMSVQSLSLVESAASCMGDLQITLSLSLVESLSV